MRPDLRKPAVWDPCVIRAFLVAQVEISEFHLTTHNPNHFLCLGQAAGEEGYKQENLKEAGHHLVCAQGVGGFWDLRICSKVRCIFSEYSSALPISSFSLV